MRLMPLVGKRSAQNGSGYTTAGKRQSRFQAESIGWIGHNGSHRNEDGEIRQQDDDQNFSRLSVLRANSNENMADAGREGSQ